MNLRRQFAFALICALTLVQADASTIKAESPAAIRAIIDNAVKTDSNSQQRALSDLNSLDKSAVPALIEVFSGRDLREHEAQVVARKGKFDVPPPPPWIQEVLLGALEKQDERELEKGLARFALKAELEERLLCLQIVERMKGNRAVDSWVALLDGIPPIRLQSTFVSGPAERSLTTIVKTTPRAVAQVTKRLGEIDPFLHATVARSVSGSSRTEALALFSDLFGENAELDLIVLREAGRLSAFADDEHPGVRFQFLTGALRNTDARYRAEAVVALARLRYKPEIDSVLEALDDIDRRVSNAALWGLKHLSGNDWGPDAQRWSSWWTAEQAWLKDSCADVTSQLTSNEPAVRLAALDELSLHRVHSYRITQALEKLGPTGDAAFETRVAAVLESFGR